MGWSDWFGPSEGEKVQQRIVIHRNKRIKQLEREVERWKRMTVKHQLEQGHKPIAMGVSDELIEDVMREIGLDRRQSWHERVYPNAIFVPVTQEEPYSDIFFVEGIGRDKPPEDPDA